MIKKCRRVILIITCFFLVQYSVLLPSAQLPFIISVCAYNASPWVEKNLDSICSQNYTNYHIVYIDDASTDDTVQKVEEYVLLHNLENKITLIKNQSRQRKMKNIYTHFHECPDEAIIVQVDADDWLPHEQVFARINATYQHEDVWLTYGQFQVYPTETLGYCREVPLEIKENRDYRKYRFVYTHIRTFYAWLVKSIRLEDLLAENMNDQYNGRFFPVANDNAIYFPMLEMCGSRYTFIPDILYIHNHSNPNYGRAIEPELSLLARTDIRSRPKYKVLDTPLLQRLHSYKDAKAEVIILSNNNPAGLTQLIISLNKHGHNVEKITVFYQALHSTTQMAYKTIASTHQAIELIPLIGTLTQELLLSHIKNSSYDHLLIAQDFVHLEKPLDLSECIYHLERTGAYGFYLNYSAQKMPFYFPNSQTEHIVSQSIHDDIHAWKFNCGLFALYNNIDMTLFRKQDLIFRLENVPAKDTQSLEQFLAIWHNHTEIDGHMVGLFYKKPHLAGKRSTIVSLAVKKPSIHPSLLENIFKQPSIYSESLTKELMDFF